VADPEPHIAPRSIDGGRVIEATVASAVALTAAPLRCPQPSSWPGSSACASPPSLAGGLQHPGPPATTTRWTEVQSALTALGGTLILDPPRSR